MSFLRHIRVFGAAWTAETARRRTHRHAFNETEFLPAALEVVETPPSPTGRAILWMIIAAAMIALMWACLSRVDMVSVAEGRLVPTGRLRSVEAAEQGVIRAIHVREGQHVTAGETLIELDPTAANADDQAARTELATAELTRARDAALLAYVAGRPATIVAQVGASPAALIAERALVDSRIQEYEAKRASLDERRAGAEATTRGSQAEITKLRSTLPLLKQQMDSQRDLERQGYGAKQRLLQQEQAYLTAQGDLEANRAKLDEAEAQVAALSRDAAESRQEFIGKAAEEEAQAESVVATRGEALKKADQRNGLQQLTAPVSGVVQEVTVTNIGESPEVGKPLVTIVPDGEALVVEALLMNRDAGFVRAGMRAAVKLDAYPFTRYGVLEGVVEHVSPDSTVDQQRGLVFPLRVKLTQTRLLIDGRPAALTAGMSAAVEVVTGRRRVIDYLWSPVAKAVGEAGRER